MAYTEEEIQAVWEKATAVGNNDPRAWRKDVCGAWISRQDYGNRDSQYGWEIDHIVPVSQGGTDEISNLRPLQWENNAATQDGGLKCVVRSSGTQNVHV